MKFLVFILMALASTITVSCLQCYDCGFPIADLLSAVKCLNRNSTCEGGNTTCISRSLIDETNQTLIARGCAPAEWCANLPMNSSGSCIECNTDNCNGDGSTVPSTTTTTTRPSTTTTTVKPAVTTTSPKVQPSVGTTTTVKPVVETTTIPKAQPTKTKNSASSAGSSLAVMLVVAVVLQFKLD